MASAANTDTGVHAHDTLPPVGPAPVGDTDRGVMLVQLCKAAHQQRHTLAANSDEIMRIAGVVGSVQAQVSDVHDAVRGLSVDVRDLNAAVNKLWRELTRSERERMVSDVEITKQVRAIAPTAAPAKAIDWVMVGKAAAAIVLAAAGALGWVL